MIISFLCYIIDKLHIIVAFLFSFSTRAFTILQFLFSGQPWWQVIMHHKLSQPLKECRANQFASFCDMQNYMLQSISIPIPLLLAAFKYNSTKTLYTLKLRQARSVLNSNYFKQDFPIMAPNSIYFSPACMTNENNTT